MAVFLGTALVASIPASSGEISILGAGGGEYHVPVQSFADGRFFRTIRQRYDFSCGSAALATLLSYHYGRPVNEQEAIKFMYNVGDKEKIRKEGFSLLDMKNYLESIGLRADGYRQSLDKLQRVGVPAIVLVNYKGYLHFVVVKGVSSTEVLLGDPAMGIRIMPRDVFEGMWNGILFVIRDDLETGRKHFNMAEEWRIRRRAPMNTALVSQGLASFTVNLWPTANYYK